MLLIKGLSHKEIATLRAVSERTGWEQARSIYSNRASSRTALSAFFLEDLLAPSQAWNSRGAVRMQRTARCAEARTRRTGLSDWVPSAFCTPAWRPMPGTRHRPPSMKSRTPKDAVRLACEDPTVDIALDQARELGLSRSAASSWTLSRTRSCASSERGPKPPHTLDLPLLHQDHQSPPSVRKRNTR